MILSIINLITWPFDKLSTQKGKKNSEKKKMKIYTYIWKRNKVWKILKEDSQTRPWSKSRCIYYSVPQPTIWYNRSTEERPHPGPTFYLSTTPNAGPTGTFRTNLSFNYHKRFPNSEIIKVKKIIRFEVYY